MSLTLLQVFLTVTVSSALVLAVLVGELSDRDEVERSLRHLASHDSLTGLPNRAQLSVALHSALVSQDTRPSRVALLVCDIDHLKAINDSVGHRGGDELITHVAQRLRQSVRPDDLVARISGDEFVVVLRDVDRDAVAALCRRIIAAVAQPVLLDGHKTATPSVSIGVAMGELGASGESVFNGADAALYEAKKLGRGRTVHFDDELRDRVREQLEIEDDLAAAFDEGQIRCVYQPEIELATGRVFGFECLARWDHPTRGLIAPGRFVPAVEVTGTAGRLFDIVLEQALDAQRDWAAAVGYHPAVAVNLSAQQLSDPGLARTVEQALARFDAPAETMWFELTETGAADAAALGSLTTLHDLGIHLALDDFGTGWSSMSRLSRHPWEIIKLDRSFVAALGTDPGAEHLVRAMIVMAHALGIRTVGEGVETPEQLACLTELGCDIVQGFLFSRPVPASQAITQVDAHGSWTGHPQIRTTSRIPAVA